MWEGLTVLGPTFFKDVGIGVLELRLLSIGLRARDIAKGTAIQ